jgi:hypothetical protein
MDNRFTRLLALGALLTALLPAHAAAQTSCFGDCNASNTLTASDIGRINSTILRCGPCEGGVPGGIATGCAALLNGCPPADFNTDGCLRASELSRANQNILKYQPSGCAPTPTATGELVPPTATETPTPEATSTSTPESVPPTSTFTSGPPTETFTPAPTHTFTPTSTSTPLKAVCPNGLLEAGEECDPCLPGELCSCAPADCKVCAADCAVSACTPVATPPRPFRVDYAPPEGQPVTAIKVRVGYRSQRMSLPGVGPTPAARVTNRPGNTTTIVNDLNYAVEVTMSRSAGLVAGRLFNLNFDGCTGQAAPALEDLDCAVLDCGSSFGSVSGCTCSVKLP